MLVTRRTIEKGQVLEYVQCFQAQHATQTLTPPTVSIYSKNLTGLWSHSVRGELLPLLLLSASYNGCTVHWNNTVLHKHNDQRSQGY